MSDRCFSLMVEQGALAKFWDSSIQGDSGEYLQAQELMWLYHILYALGTTLTHRDAGEYPLQQASAQEVGNIQAHVW